MTILPNAPIDDDTGLPVPTIAVATDGGVSVIRDDGSVVDEEYAKHTNRNSCSQKNSTLITAHADQAIRTDIEYQIIHRM